MPSDQQSFEASHAPRAPGLRATFNPRKEDQVFLARGGHSFTLPGRAFGVTVNVIAEGENDEAALNAEQTTIAVFWDKAHSKPLAEWSKLNRVAKTSVHGIVNEDRATRQHVWLLRIFDFGDLQRSLFAAVYPCESDFLLFDNCEEALHQLSASLPQVWIRHKRSDRLPVQLSEEHPELITMIMSNGLGFTSPTDSDLILLDRNAFWQGAGVPRDLHWLQTAVPATGVFPYTLSFTRSESPPVLTTHPLRPPKPAPGSVVYSRYVFSCQQHLELVHIDAENPEHFDAYCRWQNSDRVNHGWREKGPDEKHRAYLQDKNRDPHAMGVLVTWDGVPAGYGEMVWSKEDGMAPFVGGLGDYDQGKLCPICLRVIQ